MNTLIFRTAAPLIVVVMLVFAAFVLLRGHNEPGGGFIAALVAAAGMAVYGMAAGPDAVATALRIPPLALAGLGVALGILAGLPSLIYGDPFLTGLWLSLPLGDGALAVSTPLLFDIGVFFAVFGSVVAVLLALERGEGGV